MVLVVMAFNILLARLFGISSGETILSLLVKIILLKVKLSKTLGFTIDIKRKINCSFESLTNPKTMKKHSYLIFIALFGCNLFLKGMNQIVNFEWINSQTEAYNYGSNCGTFFKTFGGAGLIVKAVLSKI